MENTKKCVKKTNAQQFKKIVELMEEHPEIAKGLGSFGSSKKTNTEMWDKFAADLNCLGPPMRDGRGWNKVWLDYKLKLKQKIAANKRESVATGGGPFTQLSLSPLEQSVDSLLGLQYVVCPSGSAFGGISRSVPKEASAPLPETAIEDIFEAAVSENTEETTGNMEAISRCVQDTPSKKRKLSASAVNEREEERIKFLKMQVEGQQELIERAKIIGQDLHDIARYKRKSLEIKKEKLNLLKEKEKRKNKERQERANMHKEKLELKLKELELKKLKYELK